MTVAIRRATEADAETLARLGERTFRETFVDDFAMDYPPDDLRALVEEAYTPAAFLDFIRDANAAIWLAETDGSAVGYASAGRCGLPHPEVTAACGELKRLYVARDAQGLGVGRRLLDAALAWLERDGPRRIWIGVWSGNDRARAVYAGRGFETVGEYGFRVGRTVDREFILRRG